MLRLVTSGPRDFFARDRNTIINCACGLLGTEYARPLDALEDVATIMDFKVVRRPLVGQARSNTVLATRTIQVCSNLINKMEHAAAVDGMAAFCLAQEIAHIRLHLFDGVPILTQEHVEEAKAYAGIFLVPRHQLFQQAAYHDMLAAGRLGLNLWGYVGELAAWFGVTKGHLVRELEHLGIVVLDRESRELKLAA